MEESALIWGITILVALAIFIPQLVRFWRRRKVNLERLQDAKVLGILRPMGQYPFIDVSKCIGCASCVAACPESDVLGIVFGKATIINGLRYVGHGYCELACPVMAIEVGLGNVKDRPDIPLMNEHLETNIPGIFLAGELTGLSLIRNAILQGRQVVDHIASIHQPAKANGVKDVAIIGFGPAGLSTTLTSLQQNLSHVVFDQQEPGGTIRQYPRRKLVMTQEVELPLCGNLKSGEYSKEKLLGLWNDVLKKLPVNLHTNEVVTNVARTNGSFTITTAKSSYHARFVVLALGRRGSPRKLGVPGEDQSKVMYQLSDAQSYQNMNLLVVGGGDSAVEAALGLARQKGNRVTISYRKDQFFRIKKKNEERIQELIRKKLVNPVFNSQVVEIREKEVILQKAGKEWAIENDHVFVFIGGEPPFKLLQDMGIAFGGKEMKTPATS